MTDPLDPLRPVGPVGPDSRRRGEDRRGRDRRAEEAGSASKSLVPVGEPVAHPPPPPEPPAGAAEFTAQVMGQNNQKRGLKGGPAVLDQARSSYLDAEYSGRNDRRPPKGRITKTEI